MSRGFEAQLPNVKWINYTNFFFYKFRVIWCSSSDSKHFKCFKSMLDWFAFIQMVHMWFECNKCFNVLRVIRATWLGNGFFIDLLIRFRFNLIRFEWIKWLDSFDFDRTTRFYLSEPLQLKSFEWFEPVQATSLVTIDTKKTFQSTSTAIYSKPKNKSKKSLAT